MTTKSALYPGETLDTIAGYPTIYNYQPSTQPTTKPLIQLFFTQDFLAHHLNNHGFNVLSLSYPLESTPSIMPPTAPNFSISDWGRQAATAAKKIISEHALPLSVVLIGWSMGGPDSCPFYCFREGTRFICGAIYQLRSHAWDFGYSTQSEYVGGTPIRLMGLRLRLNGDGRSFVLDEVTHEEDSRVWDFANCPLVSALCPTGAMDASHAMADIATWGFILTYQLEGLVGKQGLAKVKETGNWEKLLGFVRDAPRRLCWSVEGNHFFFVGEKAAGEVADKVSKLIDEAAMFRRELDEILS
ncbi:hypothetical protein N7526_004248 [Penicillium atrosanguineum]|nr:hypothetical protein N7526_004248 [Penicillium atrosanguineum]